MPISSDWRTPLEPICAAIAQLLSPHAEVVLHDLAADAIVAIWNPLSGRGVGDESLIDELPESWRTAPVQGPYAKVLADGRSLSAVSAVIHDADGVAQGLLCINFDRSALDAAADTLRGFAAPLMPRPAELFARDWREHIALAVDEECQQRGLSRGRLMRADRLALVEALDQRGLFATRRAAEHAARALGVSRATIYTMLKEVRAEARAA
jgi:predicted transcriptional regulator YheO